MTLLGVDVSSYAGPAVDWSKVAASGISFAINRACLDLRPDPTWARNTAEARKHGLIAGAYHFLYPSGGSGSAAQPAAAQCDAFLKVIGDPEGLLIALDVESDGGGIYQPTFADVKAWVARFREKHPTHPLLIYTGAWYWNSSSHPIHDADASRLGLLWDSRYVAVSSPRTAQHLYASVPASWWTPGFGGWPRVTVLQFTSSAAVPGVSGACDVSAFLGTVEQLRALASSKPATPSPEVDMFPLATYTPGSTIIVKPTSNVRADAKLGAAILRVVSTTETWTIVGSVKGDVDPDGGSDVWYVRWGNGHWEYTAKSNVTSGPTAPVADCTAAVSAATGPLKTQIATQASLIAARDADVAALNARLTTAANDERDRLADAEAARIRSL